jgi:hypothetical protein
MICNDKDLCWEVYGHEPGAILIHVLQKLIEAYIEWQHKMILDLDECLKTRFGNLKRHRHII